MKRSKVLVYIGCLCLVCVTQSGCALLMAPFQLIGGLIGGTFGLLGQALQVAQSMPTPPPWVFF